MRLVFRRFTLVAFILCVGVAPVLGQVPTPIPFDESPVETVLEAEAQANTEFSNSTEEIQFLMERTQLYAEDAARYAADASNFLGLFEAIGITLTVVIGAAGFIGITRLVMASNELNKSREKFEQAIQNNNAQLLELETQLKAMHNELNQEIRSEVGDVTQSLQSEAKNTALALSMLPLGESQYRAGDLSGARKTYQRALQLDSHNPIIYYRLGYVLLKNKSLNDLQEAEGLFKRALEIDPEFTAAKAALGFAYRRISDFMDEDHQKEKLMDLAVDNLREALFESPFLVDDDLESWYGALGGVYLRQDRRDKAVESYERASKVTPYTSYPVVNLAMLYGDRGDIASMKTAYQKVERLSQAKVNAEVGYVWAYNDLLTAKLALKKLDEARDLLPVIFEMISSSSDYELNALISTLKRLHKALEEKEGAYILEFVHAVETERERREKVREQNTNRFQADGMSG